MESFSFGSCIVCVSVGGSHFVCDVRKTNARLYMYCNCIAEEGHRYRERNIRYLGI